MNAPPEMNKAVGETALVKREESTSVSNPNPAKSEKKDFASTSPSDNVLVALFARAAAAARAMKCREFEVAKAEIRANIVYCLHDIGTDTGLLVPVDRNYHVVGFDPRRAPYAYDAPEFASVRLKDTPAVRRLATEIIKRSWRGTGPTLYVLADDDTRQAYARRMEALAACVAEWVQA